MRKISNAIIFSAIVCLSVACEKGQNDVSVSDLYTPTVVDTSAYASLQDLQDGKELYIGNCNACHRYYLPQDYNVSDWKNIMNEMAPQTSMSPDEALKVTKYLNRGKQ